MEDTNENKNLPQKTEIESKKEETKPNPKSVLIGMTGRIDSMVAAYLLKMQGLEVTALTINFYDENDKELQKRSQRTQLDLDSGTEEAKNDTGFIQRLRPRCFVPDMDAVNKLAHDLGISHFAVNAYDEYRENIMARMISAGLEANHFLPCIRCHKFIVKLLREKADTLGITMIATGHFAKIQYNAKDKVFFISGSADQEGDQSKYLSEVPQEELARMVLPLANMRKSEVQKIAESMKWELLPKVLKNNKQEWKCFENSRDRQEMIERLTPPSLRKNGQLLRYEDDSVVEDHNGIHNFEIGQLYEGKNGHLNEGPLEVVKIFASNNSVYLGPQEKLHFKKIFLSRFYPRQRLDRSRPLRVFVEFDLDHVRHGATLLFKTLGCVQINLDEEMKGQLGPGHQVFIYDKKEVKGSKFLGKGEVHSLDEFAGFSCLTRLGKEKTEEEEKELERLARKEEDKDVQF